MDTDCNRSDSASEDYLGRQFELLRKAGPLESLANIFSVRGIQSNVVIAARYTHPTKSLTPSRVYRALAKVIAENPELSIVGVSQPSERKKFNHRLWEARLHSINLHHSVEFVSEDVEDDKALARVLEKSHSRWLINTSYIYEKILKPYWRLVIINGTHAAFIYHHMIGDGLSGYAFHRSLLAALNAADEEPSSPEGLFDAVETTVKSSSREPQPHALDQIDQKISWLGLLYYSLIRFFIRRQRYIFSDAIVSKENPLLEDPFLDLASKRTVTKVEILRIDHRLMQKCLIACREYETSFTGLLHTLIQVSLAADIYSKASIGFSRLAINLHPFLRTDPGRDVFTDAVSFMHHAHFLAKYRLAGSELPSPEGEESPPETASSGTQDVPLINAPAIWELAAEYKRAIASHISPSGYALHDFVSCKLYPEDDENIMRLYSRGLYQQNSFLLSNIGVFEPRDGMADNGWKVEDVAFSAAALRARLNDSGVAFNVGSVSGGDCVVAVSYEKGVLRDEMVRELLKGVKGRLEGLLA